MSKETMYYCGSCGAIFEEPGVVEEDPSAAGVSLPRGVIVTETCPECGSGYFTEAERCPVCGKWHKENRGLSAMCQDCAEHIYKAVDEVICWVRDQNPALDYEAAKKIVQLKLNDLIEI